jgi:hypothetical protein
MFIKAGAPKAYWGEASKLDGSKEDHDTAKDFNVAAYHKLKAAGKVNPNQKKRNSQKKRYPCG